MEMFKAMRPPSPAIGEDIRVPAQRTVPTVGGARDLHDLAMTPGSPAYRARIPRPPCHHCGEDHFPGSSYDHELMSEPVAVHDEPVAATAVVRRPQVIDMPPPVLVAFRVALYVARGDTYAVCVETPPDWDQVESWKVEPAMVMPLINLARALGQKIVDRTGGDLLMLEQEYVSQHAQDHGRGTPSAGGRGARRSGLDTDRPQESEPDDEEPAH